MNPHFSVLIANYNNAKFLKECIDSVLLQTYTNFEVIFVDDGSLDQSLEIIQNYKELDDRIKIFSNGINKGVGFTKNRMIVESSGEICGILDSDDYLRHDTLELMVKAHQEHPDASVIYSSTVYFDEGGPIEGVYRKTAAQPKNTSVLDESQISHLVTFKKQCYDKTIGINRYLKGAEDLDLYILLEEVGKIQHLDEDLYFHRMHSGGISQGSNKDYMADWAFIVRSSHLIRRGKDIKLLFSKYKNWYRHDTSVFSNRSLLKIIIRRLWEKCKS